MTRDDVHIHKKQLTYECRGCGSIVDRREVSKDALKAKRCEECWQYLTSDLKGGAFDQEGWCGKESIILN